MILRKDKNSKKYFNAHLYIGVVMLLMMLFSSSMTAKTLDKYKENIQHLQEDFASIISEDVDDTFLKEVFAEIPEILPAEEKIEVGEMTLEINNQWLGQEINKYKNTADRKEKLRIMYAVFERLNAIEIKINELQRSVETGPGKDQEKRKLAEILKREEFQKPAEGEESLIQQFFNWLDKWMRRLAGQQDSNPLPVSNMGSVVYVLQILLFTLVIIAVGFLIYKFGPFFIRKFGDREGKKKTEQIILGERIAAHETSDNLFNEAEELARRGDLREAIRKGYVAFLFELSERKLIGLAKHKTNRDYLRAIRKKRELYKNMNGLTINYERHWYGFEEADEQDWQEFRHNYNDALDEK
jgi:hypothetical protein